MSRNGANHSGGKVRNCAAGVDNYSPVARAFSLPESKFLCDINIV